MLSVCRLPPGCMWPVLHNITYLHIGHTILPTRHFVWQQMCYAVAPKINGPPCTTVASYGLHTHPPLSPSPCTFTTWPSWSGQRRPNALICYGISPCVCQNINMTLGSSCTAPLPETAKPTIIIAYWLGWLALPLNSNNIKTILVPQILLLCEQSISFSEPIALPKWLWHQLIQNAPGSSECNGENVNNFILLEHKILQNMKIFHFPFICCLF